MNCLSIEGQELCGVTEKIIIATVADVSGADSFDDIVVMAESPLDGIKRLIVV